MQEKVGLAFDKGKSEVLLQYWSGMTGALYEDSQSITTNFGDYVNALLDKEYEVCDELVNEMMIGTAWEMDHGEVAEILKDVHKVCKMGAAKYGLDNYRSGILFSRRLNSAARHLLKYFVERELLDKESKQHHLIHFVANLLIVNSYCKCEILAAKFNDLETYISSNVHELAEEEFAFDTYEECKAFELGDAFSETPSGWEVTD